MNDLYKSFETWWSSDKSQFTEDDELKQFAWSIWQASRGAIELELPKTFPGEYNTLVMYVDDVESSLESAGIKVKE